MKPTIPRLAHPFPFPLPLPFTLALACAVGDPSTGNPRADGPSMENTDTGSSHGEPGSNDESTSSSTDPATTGHGTTQTDDDLSDTDTTTDQTTSSAAPVCGNGVVEADEECDDGNADPHDDCRGCAVPACGDGFVDAGQACYELGDPLVTDLGPRELALADMDGDGNPDVVTLVAGSHGVQTLFLAGDGSPIRSETVLAHADPVGLAVGDVDDDGDPDVLVASPKVHQISMLANDAGSLSPPTAAGSAFAPVDVLLGHTDLDGRVDLVVPAITLVHGDGSPGNGHEIQLHGGGGDGTFPTASHEPLEGVGIDVAVTDADLDGRADLFVALLDPPRLEVLRGDGRHGMDRAGTLVLASAPSVIATGLLDDDAVPDVVIGYADATVLTVAIGDGNGAFQTIDTVPIGLPTTCLGLADVDADGAVDLLVGRGDPGVFVLGGDGSGRFGPIDHVPLTGVPAAFAAADLDGDGVDDILAAIPGAHVVDRLLSRP